MQKSIQGRHLAVFFLIAVLPFASGLIMLDPDRAMILGLASLSIMILPIAMLVLWPEVRAGLLPRGRLAALTALVLVFAVLLAFTRAPHTGFSLMAVQFWLGALITGRAMQLIIRAYGAKLGHIALVVLLATGPLYVTLLPLMDLVYGAQGTIDWVRDMPGFNHIRKMGHLLTLSGAAGLGLALVPRVNSSRQAEIALTVIGILAVALVLWTGARGAWLSLSAGAGLAMLMARQASLSLRWGRVMLMVLAGLAVTLILPTPNSHLGLVQELQNSSNRINDLNALSSNRLLIWQNTLDLITQAQVSGYGWGQYLLIQDTYAIPQVHNFPLELVLGLGLPIGLLAIGIVMTLWFEAHRRAIHGGPTAIAALCVLDTMALYSLVSGTYYYGVPVVLTGLVWGICLASPKVARP